MFIPNYDIDLKTIPRFYRDVVAGNKSFESRYNDRKFKVGQIVRLSEYDPETQEYTGEFCLVRITYILDDPAYCKEGFVVFQFEIIAYGVVYKLTDLGDGLLHMRS